MTNEQIVEQSSNGGKEFVNMYDMMELARQDEREKMQGCDVWVSWDSSNRISNPYLSDREPIAIEKKFGIYYDVEEGSQIYGFNPDLAANYLGVKPGQCKKFRIVEVVNGEKGGGNDK